MDAHYAVVLDLCWDNADSPSTPSISSETIPVDKYQPDQELQQEMTKAYSGRKGILNMCFSMIFFII